MDQEGFAPLIRENLAAALAKQGIFAPTAIQTEAIPQILSGRDVIAQSPTGTGKTLAYLLPALRALELSEREGADRKALRVLVIAPSYELAAQIHAQACLLWGNAEFEGTGPALLIGGAGIARQIDALKQKPRIAIGSPGRVAELIKMRKLTAHFIQTVVLDEYDRLFDKSVLQHTLDIMKAIPKSRQTLLFQATPPRGDVFGPLVNDPVYITVSANRREMPEALTHRAIMCDRRDKHKAIRSLIHAEKTPRALIFVKNADEAERTAERLRYHGIKAAALSANLNGPERKAALEGLRNGFIEALVATDAAARGLDIAGLTHVVNMEPPRDADEYLHRAGRTARMGRSGCVVTLAAAGERERLGVIERVLGILIEK